MSGITANGNTAKHFLQVSLRSEDVFLAFHDAKQPVVVARNTSQINRNDSLRFWRYSSLNSLIIHFKAIFLYINKNKRSPHVLHNRSTCCVSISRHNHLVTFTHTQQAQSHFATSRLRVQAHSLVNANKRSHFFFQLLCTRSSCYPARQNSITHF